MLFTRVTSQRQTDRFTIPLHVLEIPTPFPLHSRSEQIAIISFHFGLGAHLHFAGVPIGVPFGVPFNPVILIRPHLTLFDLLRFYRPFIHMLSTTLWLCLVQRSFLAYASHGRRLACLASSSFFDPAARIKGEQGGGCYQTLMGGDGVYLALRIWVG